MLAQWMDTCCNLPVGGHLLQPPSGWTLAATSQWMDTCCNIPVGGQLLQPPSGWTLAATSQWVDTCCNLPRSLLTQFIRQSKLGTYINVTGVHKSRHQVAQAINVVQLFLILVNVDHQHGICSMSRSWHLEFGSSFTPQLDRWNVSEIY